MVSRIQCHIVPAVPGQAYYGNDEEEDMNAVFWLDRVLPGVIAGQLTVAVAYIKLHFEKDWPYWGRKH